MNADNKLTVRKAQDIAPRSVYQITVGGRLEGDHWADWFEGMTIVVISEDKTVITGPLIDQAAVYGLLSRLSDLALPLLGMEIISEEDAKRKKPKVRSNKRRKLRINWMMFLLYLLITGGLVGLTVFFTSSGILHTALALALLFGANGWVADLFFRQSDARGWRVLAVIGWSAGGLTLLIYLTIVGWLPTALLLSLLAFFAAGGLAYLIFNWNKEIPVQAVESESVFEPLGRSPKPSGPEADYDRASSESRKGV